MKTLSKVLALAVVLCLMLTVCAMAAEYGDGLVVNDDGTFTMVQAGENTDGEAFDLTVAGTVDADGNFTITSLMDGDIELIDMATEDQLAGNYAALEAAYAGGADAASAEAAGVVPGTYEADGLTLVIADDMTFSMVQDGENTDGEGFALTVSGTVTEDGVFTITSLMDGDMELIDLATEDQMAENLATVEATYAAAAGSASGEASAEAEGGDYVAYIREFLENELANNSDMTQEQIDNEFMPLIEAGDYETFPADMLYSGMLNTGSAMTYDEFMAQ